MRQQADGAVPAHRQFHHGGHELHLYPVFAKVIDEGRRRHAYFARDALALLRIYSGRIGDDRSLAATERGGGKRVVEGKWKRVHSLRYSLDVSFLNPWKVRDSASFCRKPTRRAFSSCPPIQSKTMAP